MNLQPTPVAGTPENYGQFESFDLTIYLGPNFTPWISASSRVGAVHGIPRLAEKIPPLDDLLDLIYDYTDDIQFAQSRSDSQMSEILGELVFGDAAVLQLFQATRGVAADRGRHVLFRILASPHLAVLPWELLPDPAAQNNGFSYLALAPDMHLARQARGRTYPTRATMLEAPLNLLLVLSSPVSENDREDWLPFDIFEVKRNLLSELEPLVRAGLLRIDVEDCPTIDNLRRRIGAQRRGYHLFHYIGHAFPEGLILEDRAGYREDLSAAKLVDLLRLCPDLRLAVFAGCETARAASDPTTVNIDKGSGWRDLLSLSDYCVQEACPAVIGMQAVLPFSTERIFTRFFYQALVNGYTVAESLRLARGAIQSDMRVGGELLDWSVPALFVGSGEPGALVPRTSAASKSEARRRAELNLGLRQRNTRFFGRDLALRQTVDVLSRRTPERVLVITGAGGVGKTSLVDRALEEAGDEISHVLFIGVNYLAPHKDRGWQMFDDDDFSENAIKQLKADYAVEKLCLWTNELLRHTGVETREREPNWHDAGEWWERIVEDLIRRQFVVIIDGIGEIDGLQQRLLEKLLGGALSVYLKKRSLQEAKMLQQEFTASPSATQEAAALESPAPSLAALFKKIEVPKEMVPEIEKLSARLMPDYRRFLEQRLFAASREQNEPGGDPGAPNPQSLRRIFAVLRHLEEVRASLGGALSKLADRRSSARIVVTGDAPLKEFFKLPDDIVFQMRLAPLTWAETWRWIRRNLPGLVVFGEEYLARFWRRFGEQLELWEELELQVLKRRGRQIDLVELATDIRPSITSRSTARSVDQTAGRGNRPLRIAVAGPHLRGKDEVAAVLTQLAMDHGIGGRVVFDTDGGGASLATLIDVPSPFGENTQLAEIQISDWLKNVVGHQPNIVLLDFGSRSPNPDLDPNIASWQELFRQFQHSILFIAAGGNRQGRSKYVTFPAAFPEVLSVGPLNDDGGLREYASWHPNLVKPDLFMPDNLGTTPLRAALGQMEQKRSDSWGSSFSAINAMATAVLVWYMFPEMSPSDVRRLLIAAAAPIPGAKGALGLTMETAISFARRRLIERTLGEGAASMQTLAAITGLERQVLWSILETMLRHGSVERLPAGRLPRFQLAPMAP